MARLSNFKGEVVAEGGECCKFALWLKHCDMHFTFLFLQVDIHEFWCESEQKLSFTGNWKSIV